MSPEEQIHLDFPSPVEEVPLPTHGRNNNVIPKFNYWYISEFIVEFAIVFGSMILYFADSASDVFLAINYYYSGYYFYFALTLLFVAIPGIVVAGFSVLFYITDRSENKQPNPTRSSLAWIAICTLFSGLQLGSILRDVETLAHKCEVMSAVKRRDDNAYKRSKLLMEKEESDAAFLRLFERFMEGAPQVTLQLFVFMYHFHDHKKEFNVGTFFFAIPLSLLGLAISITSFNRATRITQDDKENLTLMGTFLQFFWHLCIITSRVFALAIFASAYPTIIIPVCVVHWIIMFVWLHALESRDRDLNEPRSSGLQRFIESLPTLIFAFIYIFIYFNTRDEPTRGKYWFFYLVCFVENTVMMFSSVWLPQHKEFSYFVISSYGLFFIGILLMWIYYRWFHPSGRFTSTYSAIKYMAFISRESRATVINDYDL